MTGGTAPMQADGREHQRAIDLLNRGKSPEGVDLLLGLLRRDPKDARACDLLARVFTESGEFERALYFAEQRLTLTPDDPAAAVFVLHVLNSAGRAADAAGRGKRLLERFGREPNFVLFVATSMSNSGRREDAESVLRDFEKRFGPEPTILSVLGANLLNQGRAVEAEAVLRRTLALFPGHLNALQTLGATLNYIEGADRSEMFRLFAEFGKRFESNFPVIDPLSFENGPDPDRTIHVGFVTSDLRAHAVARFVEPILKHHDPSQARITVYYTYPIEDAVTARLKPLADQWRSVRTTRADAISREVYKDRIDVLIDLGGLSGNSTVSALVPQVAPVQATAIGYANTTGIRTIGCRIVDSLTDPPGESDAFATERLVRLDPCFLCFQPLESPAPARAVRSAAPVFGSFNSIVKYTDEAFALWARILNRVPGSSLLLKNGAFESQSVRDRFLARLARAGVSAGRIELAGSQASAADHLSMYNRVDVALDTFPYNGTTTTCESLLMGVPVVSLDGSTHAGRVGASLLHAAAVPDFLAHSPDEYIQRAVSLAPARTDASRADLRNRFLGSALCDGPAYAARWHGAISSMWREWCERKRNQSSPSAPR